jgi:hypothetical protein
MRTMLDRSASLVRPSRSGDSPERTTSNLRCESAQWVDSVEKVRQSSLSNYLLTLIEDRQVISAGPPVRRAAGLPSHEERAALVGSGLNRSAQSGTRSAETRVHVNRLAPLEPHHRDLRALNFRSAPRRLDSALVS